jgi:hypothetical protein
MGKLLHEARAEVDLSADILDYHADRAEDFLEPKSLNVAERQAWVETAPLGIIFCIEPWNFPYYQLARVAAPNLMVGNTVIVRHAPKLAKGYAVAVLNPLRTRCFAEEELQWTKTDAIDALGIARFAAQKRPPAAQLPDVATEELRELSRCATGSRRTFPAVSGSCIERLTWAFQSSRGMCARSRASLPPPFCRVTQLRRRFVIVRRRSSLESFTTAPTRSVKNSLALLSRPPQSPSGVITRSPTGCGSNTSVRILRCCASA